MLKRYDRPAILTSAARSQLFLTLYKLGQFIVFAKYNILLGMIKNPYHAKDRSFPEAEGRWQPVPSRADRRRIRLTDLSRNLVERGTKIYSML